VTSELKLLIVGIGGQGVVSAARFLGRAATSAGLEAWIGQLHGMSQRGGSVESTVCLGGARTGFVAASEADVVLALEPLEAERAIPRMSSRTLVLVEPRPIIPLSLRLAGGAYPELDGILGRIAAVAADVHTVDSGSIALEVGAPRSLNVAMIAALTAFDVLPFGTEALRAAVEAISPARFLDVNLRAFDLGCEQGRRARVLGAAR